MANDAGTENMRKDKSSTKNYTLRGDMHPIHPLHNPTDETQRLNGHSFEFNEIQQSFKA